MMNVLVKNRVLEDDHQVRGWSSRASGRQTIYL